MRTRLPDFARGLLALTALLALLGGVPAALVTQVGWPLPTAIPSRDAVVGAVRYGQVADATLIKVLAVIVWTAWAQLAVAVTVETSAVVRGRTTNRIPGIGAMQLAASRLVPAAMLVFSSFDAPPATADPGAHLEPSTAAAAAAAPEDPVADTALPADTAASAAPDGAEPASSRARPADRLYEVQRGDTLWGLAERALGDGHRWSEIRDLNAGRPQPDGGALAPDGETIRRGWRLVLPGHPQLSAQPDPGRRLGSVVVEPGDTLSGIAQRAYGSGDAYPVIFDANAGRPQPDGATLADPDLIRPGWRLDIPDVATGASPTQDKDTAPPADAGSSLDPPSAGAVPDDQAAAQDAAPADELSAPDPRLRETDRPGSTVTGIRPRPTPAAGSPHPQPTPTTAPTLDPAAEPVDSSGGDAIRPVMIGVSSLVAGTLLWALTRLRGRQLRRRRPDHDLPTPGPELRQAERQFRAAAAADQPVEWLDATLRLLTVRLRERQPTTGTPPSVLSVRPGALGVETLLAQPDHNPPAGFQAADGGYTWKLDPAIPLEKLQEAAADAPPITPAMVTLGATPEGPLLANLEHLAILSVEGPDEHVKAFISGVTVELATAPWAAGVTVHPVVGPDDPLAGLPGVQPVAALAEIAPTLQAVAEANRAAIGAAETTLGARAAPDGEDWPASVVVVPRPHEGDEQALGDLLNAASKAGGGLAMVVAGAARDAVWRLQISDDGTATLDPLGLRVTVAGLDQAATAAAAGLLGIASAGDHARPTPLNPPDQPARSQEEGDEEDTPALQPLPVEVAVLGPPAVTGWAADDVRPKSAEIVTYLAVRGRPVPTYKLQTALWPNGINYNSFKTTISRTRHALGVDRHNAFHLPEANDGRYRLGPDVGCDWTRFQTLVAAARTAAPARAGVVLRNALTLVRGTPFDGAAGSGYQWVYDEQIISEIEVAAVDAAHRLAELALDTEDADLAIWAARQGHLVTPGHEGLYRARMRAHALAGDLDAVHQTFREAQRAAQALDPLDDVQPDTHQLYHQLTRRQQAASGA
ncbi:MAG: LysM peptidoglycan-binding domain-containing protein [Micromonosporaceae bacterium]|nr:LysM peptidoglycan-binding domain-containing protein [Micromonosporaceae bacterium]